MNPRLISSLLKTISLISITAVNFGCSSVQSHRNDGTLPNGFVSLHDVDPSILLEMRYVGNHNFLGMPVAGYHAEKCILTQEAAQELTAVQSELKQYSMSLKVYDCYRPQRAVDGFVEWAKDLSDNKMKKEFYPRVEKTHLFRDGYIAEKSGHSRGSTIDLTIVPIPTPSQSEYKDGAHLVECFQAEGIRFKDNTLDFGTGFDCFDLLAHTSNPHIGLTQKRNRLLLKSMMEKHGFKNLAEEWWHYTLKKEPFPNQYFDFEIQ